jgi:hypothetical protein
MAELVCGPAFDVRDERAVTDFFARAGLDPSSAQALAPELEGLLVYRTLVRNTLSDALKLALPRTLARLAGGFDTWFDAFLAERGPRTHYLRDVTGEFLDFVAPRWANDASVPAWLIDLARHEALAFQVAAAPPAEARPLADTLELERGLVFDETARIVHYAYAVHELSEDPHDAREPEPRATALFVYRNAEHDVRYLALTPLAARILERLLAGDSLRVAIGEACAERNLVPEPAVLDATAGLLAQLAERGALLGPAPLQEPAQRPSMDSARAEDRP